MKTQIQQMSLLPSVSPQVKFIIAVNRNCLSEVYDLLYGVSEGKKYTVEIKQYRQKRSLTANAYMWQLCEKIAEKVGTSKEVVYRKNISEVGVFEILQVAEAAVERFINIWQMQGLGWIAETIGSPNNGMSEVMAYYGSSTYNTKEMSRLIDSVVQEAQDLGISTMTPDEISLMKSEWSVK